MIRAELESQVLNDPECPWSSVLNNKAGRAISVRSLRKFAEARDLDADEAEAAMDAYVRERNGKRQRITDPWGTLPNLVRKLRGQHPQADDVWLIPES